MTAFTPSQIEIINAALAEITKDRSRLRTAIGLRTATVSGIGGALATIHANCQYIARRDYTEFGARVSSRKAAPAHYEATCDLGHGLDCSASGHTPMAAYTNLFKALRVAAQRNEPRIVVPLVLSHPTEAAKQARAEREAKANAEALRRAREWYADLDRAVTAIEAERAAAPTIIVAASHDAALDVKSEPTRIVCNNAAPSPEELTVLIPRATKRSGRFVEAPIIPAGAEAGTELTFKALLGLSAEQKIVALVNALHAAGVTIHRADDDGAPIIRAAMPFHHPDLSTVTVLNL